MKQFEACLTTILTLARKVRYNYIIREKGKKGVDIALEWFYKLRECLITWKTWEMYWLGPSLQERNRKNKRIDFRLKDFWNTGIV